MPKILKSFYNHAPMRFPGIPKLDEKGQVMRDAEDNVIMLHPEVVLPMYRYPKAQFEAGATNTVELSDAQVERLMLDDTFRGMLKRKTYVFLNTDTLPEHALSPDERMRRENARLKAENKELRAQGPSVDRIIEMDNGKSSPASLPGMEGGSSMTPRIPLEKP